jgi:hypothetical protein
LLKNNNNKINNNYNINFFNKKLIKNNSLKFKCPLNPF